MTLYARSHDEAFGGDVLPAVPKKRGFYFDDTWDAFPPFHLLERDTPPTTEEIQRALALAQQRGLLAPGALPSTALPAPASPEPGASDVWIDDGTPDQACEWCGLAIPGEWLDHLRLVWGGPWGTSHASIHRQLCAPCARVAWEELQQVWPPLAR